LSPHVFGDESKAHGLLLAAAYVPPEDLGSLRAVVNGLRKRGQRRLHFAREEDNRRKQVVRALAEVGVRSVVYDATPYRDAAKARRLAVGQLVDDALAAGAAWLVLEQDDSLVASDLTVIKQRLRASGSAIRLHYAHHRATQECLLSIPDAIAWCWAKGGEWRKLAETLVEDVRLVEDTGGDDLRLDTRNPAHPPSGRLPGSLRQDHRLAQLQGCNVLESLSTRCCILDGNVVIVTLE
jgi:hypothetical protein